MTHVWRVLLAMNGIVPGHMRPWRWAVILGSIAGYYLVLAPRPTPSLALWYFAGATLLHYVYLFGMFATNGWSETLRARWGEAGGYRVHEGWMAFVFLHNGMSIGYLCWVTGGMGMAGAALPSPVPAALAAPAALAVVVGLGTKVWATLIVGIGAYYYHDLFLERAGGDFRREGPYRWLRNPMYTVGHLHAYGVALWYGSVWGLAAAATNQALVLLFNALVEQPHVRRVHLASAVHRGVTTAAPDE